MPNVEIPGVGVVAFPEGTPDSTMARIAKQHYEAANQPAPSPATSPVPAPQPTSPRINVLGQPDEVGYLPTRDEAMQIALALGGNAIGGALGLGGRLVGRFAPEAGEAASAAGKYVTSKIPMAEEGKLLWRLFGRKAPQAAAEAAPAAAETAAPATMGASSPGAVAVARKLGIPLEQAATEIAKPLGAHEAQILRQGGSMADVVRERIASAAEGVPEGKVLVRQHLRSAATAAEEAPAEAASTGASQKAATGARRPVRPGKTAPTAPQPGVPNRGLNAPGTVSAETRASQLRAVAKQMRRKPTSGPTIERPGEIVGQFGGSAQLTPQQLTAIQEAASGRVTPEVRATIMQLPPDMREYLANVVLKRAVNQ